MPICRFMLRNKKKFVAPFLNFPTTNLGRAKPPAYKIAREGPARGTAQAPCQRDTQAACQTDRKIFWKLEGAGRTSD
jgi:hypothetical protein